MQSSSGTAALMSWPTSSALLRRGAASRRLKCGKSQRAQLYISSTMCLLATAAPSPRACAPRQVCMLSHAVPRCPALKPAAGDMHVLTWRMQLSLQKGVGGIYNKGFWGIAVEAGKSYQASALVATAGFACSPDATNTVVSLTQQPCMQALSCIVYALKNGSSMDRCSAWEQRWHDGMQAGHQSAPQWLRMTLQSEDGSSIYASTRLALGAPGWQRMEVQLTSDSTDARAKVGISFEGPGTLLLDAVSLWPAENVRPGELNPWPFRADLLGMLAALRPRCMPLSFCWLPSQDCVLQCLPVGWNPQCALCGRDSPMLRPAAAVAPAQVPEAPWRLLCGGRGPAEGPLPLEERAGPRQRPAGALEWGLALLEHRWCSPDAQLCFASLLHCMHRLRCITLPSMYRHHHT
jgi:hypothetical protein